MIRRTLMPVLAVLALAVAGCGDDAGDVTDVGAGSGSGDDAGGAAADVGEVVLLVELEGAFTTREAALQMLPQTVVYSGGTVIEPGAQILIYPGPALPAVHRSVVDAATVEAIATAARDAGLDAHDVDYGQPPVADAGDTVVSIEVDGEVFVHRATALGLESAAVAAGGIDDEQAAARERLSSFLDEARRLVADGVVEEAAPYAADRFRIVVQPGSEVEAEPGFEPSTLEWDVEGVELTASDCTPVELPGADDLADLLADADALTRFIDGGEEWVVVARPVLPHEVTCPEA